MIADCRPADLSNGKDIEAILWIHKRPSRFCTPSRPRPQAACREGKRHTVSLDFDAGDSRFTLEPAETYTPERLFDRQWAITLLARVLDKLREGFDERGRVAQFEQLKASSRGRSGQERTSAWRRELGMSEGAVKVAVHRLRKRYRELLRHEIAQTVRSPDEIDDEIRSPFAVLGA